VDWAVCFPLRICRSGIELVIPALLTRQTKLILGSHIDPRQQSGEKSAVIEYCIVQEINVIEIKKRGSNLIIPMSPDEA